MASASKWRPKPELASPRTRTYRSSRSSPSPPFLVEPSPISFPSKSEFFRLIAVVAIAAAVAAACNAIVTSFSRQPKPFCDNNVEFDDSFYDACEPCPTNGLCHKGKLECAHGFKNLGRSCVEDKDINEVAKKLVRFLENRVCGAYARYLCDGIGTAWAREDELWQALGDMKNHGSENAIYVYAKYRALEAAGKLLEIRENSNGIKEMKCPELLVDNHKPLTCFIRQWILERAFVLVSICALVSRSCWMHIDIDKSSA